MIIIISFVRIGPDEVVNQNNAFFILILCIICFWFQIQHSPFITSELNNLDFQATGIMIITVFAGLFSSISQTEKLQLILLVIILVLNIYFMLIFLRNFFLAKTFATNKNNKVLVFFKSLFEKYLPKGFLILLKIFKLIHNKRCGEIEAFNNFNKGNFRK